MTTIKLSRAHAIQIWCMDVPAEFAEREWVDADTPVLDGLNWWVEIRTAEDRRRHEMLGDAPLTRLPISYAAAADHLATLIAGGDDDDRGVWGYLVTIPAGDHEASDPRHADLLGHLAAIEDYEDQDVTDLPEPGPGRYWEETSSVGIDLTADGVTVGSVVFDSDPVTTGWRAMIPSQRGFWLSPPQRTVHAAGVALLAELHNPR